MGMAYGLKINQRVGIPANYAHLVRVVQGTVIVEVGETRKILDGPDTFKVKEKGFLSVQALTPATVHFSAPEPEAKVEEAEAAPESDLAEKSLKDLNKLAAKKGIEGRSKMKKAELIEALS